AEGVRMADRVLRGSRLGAVSYETDRDTDLAPRRLAKYQTASGDVYEVPFADDAEIPGTWMCKNGQEGQLIDGPATETKKVKPPRRSEEHTSELQSRFDLVCRLLLEKKTQGAAG